MDEWDFLDEDFCHEFFEDVVVQYICDKKEEKKKGF